MAKFDAEKGDRGKVLLNGVELAGGLIVRGDTDEGWFDTYLRGPEGKILVDYQRQEFVVEHVRVSPGSKLKFIPERGLK